MVENLVEIPGGGAHKGYVGKNPADPSLLASDPSYCRLQFSTHLFNCATPSSGNQNKIWLNHLAPKFGKSYLTFHLSEHDAGFMFVCMYVCRGGMEVHLNSEVEMLI